MIIKDIHISGYGQFNNRDFTFTPGINLICGHNESGKSTLHSFISHMLYGMNRGRGKASRSDAYTKYCPWDYPDSFGGSLLIETDDKSEYLIERRFSSSCKSLSVTNIRTGEKWLDDENFLKQLTAPVTENAFNTTLSISQSGADSKDELTELIRMHIFNVGCTSSFNIDISNALKILNSKKKKLSSEINQDARKSYYETLDSINSLNSELEKYRQKIISLPPQCQENPENAESRIKDLSSETEKLICEHTRLNEKLASKGFRSISDVISLEMQHEKLYKALQSDKDICHTVPSRTVTAEKNLTISDIIKASLTSLTLIISIICFSLGAKSGGVILLIIAFIAGIYTASPFLQDLLSGHPWYDRTFGVLYTRLNSGLRKGNHEFGKGTHINVTDIKNRLINIYSVHISRRDISRISYNAFKEYISEIKRDFERADALNNTISEYREQMADIRENMVNMKSNNMDSAKLFWESDNIQSKLDDLETSRLTLEKILDENEHIKEEIESIDTAIKTIRDIASQMHTQSAPELNRAVSNTFNMITRRDYGELLISENLEISFNDGRHIIPIESLSHGTVEQIYMSLRLCAAEFLYKDTCFPMIIDEAFAMYDNPRLAQILKYLNSNRKGQTFIFSCQNREKLVLEKLGIPFNLIRL